MKHFGLKRIQSGCIEGKLMMLCGALTAIPMLIACFYPETLSDLAAFAIPALSSLIAGAVVCLKNQPDQKRQLLRFVCLELRRCYRGAAVCSGRSAFLGSEFV